MIGPVSTLQIKGNICPCLTSPKENEVKQAISTISSLRIQYSTLKSSLNNDKKGVGKFVSKLFSNAAAAVSSTTDGSSDGNTTSGGYKCGRMNVRDSIRGPILSFELKQAAMIDVEDFHENETSSDDDNNVNDENVTIALKEIGSIEANKSFMTSSSDAGVIIYKKMKGTANANHSDGKVELIRFKIFSKDPFDGGAENLVNGEERDDVMGFLNTIVEWDSNRRKLDPNTAMREDENDGDAKEGGTGLLGQKALKAKYFIQKEIEMKKQVKDRESRKARYMKDSGGLKYTALAMANREMS